MRIMIVDDHRGFRTWLSEVLSARGHDCLGFADGAGALAAWSAWQPRWIVLDLCLPGSDGINTLRELRLEGCTARVVILTAFDDPESRRRAESNGAESFLPKERIAQLLELLDADTNS